MNRTKSRMKVKLLLAIACALALSVGCRSKIGQNPNLGGSGGSGEEMDSGATNLGGNGGAGGDAPGPAPDSGADPSDEDCFTNPTTHLEIINACTDAVKVDKTPELEGLLPNGDLPPLP